MSKKMSNPYPPTVVSATPIEQHLSLLGYEVKDKVSNYRGVVISVAYDLYGCIQADVRPKELSEEGYPHGGYWVDVARLMRVSKQPLMEQPDFGCIVIAEGKKGPANLPQRG